MRRILFIAAFVMIGLEAGAVPQRAFSGRLEVGEGSVNLRVDIPLSVDTRLDGGFASPLEEPMVGHVYSQLVAKEYRAFAGRGALRDWRALRSRPYGASNTGRASPWTAADGTGSAALLFAFEAGGLRFYSLAEPSGKDISGATGSFSGALGASLRSGGMELAMESGVFAGAVSASLAAMPPEAPGEGWRAGNDGWPQSSSLSVSSALRASSGGSKAGAWASACAGSLESPGFAFSIDGSACAGSVGSTLEGRVPELGLSAFLFAAGPGYRTPSGESPRYDFAAEVAASVKAASWALAARLSIRSFTDETVSVPSRRVRDEAVRTWAGYGWRWRTDVARGALDLRLGGFSCAAKLAADGGALRSGSLDFRSDQRGAEGGPGLRLSASARIGFARRGVEESEEGEDSESEDSAEAEALPGGWWELPAVESLALRSLKAACRLTWGDGRSRRLFGRGNAEAAFSALWKDGEIAFSLAGSFSQALGMPGGFELTLSLATPEGGYALDVLPVPPPVLAIEFSFPLV